MKNKVRNIKSIVIALIGISPIAMYTNCGGSSKAKVASQLSQDDNLGLNPMFGNIAHYKTDQKLSMFQISSKSFGERVRDEKISEKARSLYALNKLRVDNLIANEIVAENCKEILQFVPDMLSGIYKIYVGKSLAKGVDVRCIVHDNTVSMLPNGDGSIAGQ